MLGGGGWCAGRAWERADGGRRVVGDGEKIAPRRRDGPVTPGSEAGRAVPGGPAGGGPDVVVPPVARQLHTGTPAPVGGLLQQGEQQLPDADRKSVVEGKSVDLGGSRSIKKNT